MLQQVVSLIFILLVLGAIAGCTSEPIEPSPPPVVEVKNEVITFGGYMQDCQEHGGFGLYSYLLMAYPGNSERFIQSIRILVEKSSRLKHQKQNNAIDEHLVNNTFIPLWSSPPAWVTEIDINNTDDLDAAARWLAQNYDHKCARELMKSSPEPGRNSIYIFSSLTRLSTGNKPAVVLIQEINDGVSALHLDVIDEYFKVSWYARRWTEKSLKNMGAILSYALNPIDTAIELDTPVSRFLSDSDEELQQMDSALVNSLGQADGDSLSVDNERTRQDLTGKGELKESENPAESVKKNRLVPGPDNQLPQANPKKKIISIIYPQ